LTRGVGRRLPVVALVAAVSLTGCAGTSTSGDAGGGAGAPGSSSKAEQQPVDIHVTITDGEVTPAGERVDVKLGQPIRLVVDSDAADELHVHSTPEHEFEVPAGAHGKVYEFTLNQPGVVEVELHELGQVVVSIAARP
jgi:hypothetical protein